MTDIVDVARGYELADRYRRDDGRVFLSGAQALARLPYEQLRHDRRAGLDTAAFVSGYPGSPLAGFDRDVAGAAKLAEADGLRIVLRPAVNEELAATAVMGSQLATTLDDCRHDGIVGIWYGKAPGLDRASDAIRHAVFAGTARHGGVVALVGDDPAAKSSTLPSSSDATLVDLHIPVLFPGDVQEAVDLGRHAVALSRASGLWTSVKIVAAVADGTGTVELHPERIRPVIPEMVVDGSVFVPRPSGRLLTPYTLDMEREFQEVRLELARRYGVDNELNRVSVDAPDAWIGIVATGHTYHEMLEALRLLGLDSPARIAAAGIRLLQLRMPVPLDPELVRRFASGLAEVVVVEEKNPTLEWMVKDALYSQPDRPLVVGKHDETGARLIPVTGTLDPDVLLAPIHSRLVRRVGEERLVDPAHRAGSAVGGHRLIPLTVNRTPFFCSGCPHNTSTRVPDGALVGGGIGCHAMVAMMEKERVGEIVGLTAMGGEGAQWIGISPFVERDHFIQNIGDGTYFHSGQLAVRAAIAAGVNITYKLLYNGTVAMTGGQDPQGAIAVPELVRILLLEGCARVLVTTDDVGRYADASLPSGVEVWDRSRLVEAQEALAAIPGTTVLIHDQACAAENRRGRKRGTVSIPAQRVVINERVCEGCGDCGAKSNCLSVQPVETPFGRKTRIDQTSCNLDFSCLEGDCPSFATVVPRGGKRRRPPSPATPPSGRRSPEPVDPETLPGPRLIVPADRCTIRMSGIGGTGVVTVSQILGTAALLDGLTVRGLDQTGLSQKAGPVVSDLRLTHGEPQPSNKATRGTVDLYLAFDLLVAAGDAHLAGASEQCTVVVGSTAAVPTGSMVVHPEHGHPPLALLRDRLDSCSRPEANVYLDASLVNDGLFGDGATTNMFLVGVAFQAGTLPLAAASIERAIGLNGVAVERNVSAFRWGRRWLVDPADVAHAAGLSDAAGPAEVLPGPLPHDLEAMLEQISLAAAGVETDVRRFAADLVGYQDEAYSRDFLGLVGEVASAEARVAPESTALTAAVARNLHKLMAYKDEYEVARLLAAPESRAALDAVGGRGAKVSLLLHPPVLRSLGMQRKLRLRRSARPVLGVLARMKSLRGHWYDPFGRSEIRRLERQLVVEYRDAVERLVRGVSAGNHADAVAIADLPDRVRGYEHLKLQRARDYRQSLAVRLAGFDPARPDGARA